MLFHFENAEELSTLNVDFIRTDLDVAITFIEIARQTQEREKAIRNLNNARKAYETVLLYLRVATLNHFEHECIERKLGLLKSGLLRQGEADLP